MTNEASRTLGPPMVPERIEFRRWQSTQPPHNFLFIRLQALGDVVITLAYIQAVRRGWPNAKIDFLTREEFVDIPRNVDLFDRVYAIGGGRNSKAQFLHGTLMLPWLWSSRYDVVVDLQRSRVSQSIRKLLRPRAWSEFDRFSPISAGERTRRTIEAAGLRPITADTTLRFHNEESALDKLRKAGWTPSLESIVLNPAGFAVSRNWPLENYAEFANRWLRNQNPQAQFLTIGTELLGDKARFLKDKIRGKVVDLVGRTSASEACAIVGRATLVLSEDSGLMHMAWVSGVPTLALFGSSRHQWSRPLGEHARCLHSGDLPCGACFEATCRYGDVHCLTRFTPSMIVEEARNLLARA